MNITTKFDLDDTVVPIRRQGENVSDPCPVCNGTGRAKLVNGGDVYCPGNYCRSGRVFRETIYRWAVAQECASAIGQVQISRSAPDRDRPDSTQYMIAATGIGSGQLWNEDDLFHMAEEAQAECDKRNAAVPA